MNIFSFNYSWSLMLILTIDLLYARPAITQFTGSILKSKPLIISVSLLVELLIWVSRKLPNLTYKSITNPSGFSKLNALLKSKKVILEQRLLWTKLFLFLLKCKNGLIRFWLNNFKVTLFWSNLNQKDKWL